MERLDELLYKKEQCLKDGETIIYIKGETMITRYNDGEALCEIAGKISPLLFDFLDMLQSG